MTEVFQKEKMTEELNFHYIRCFYLFVLSSFHPHLLGTMKDWFLMSLLLYYLCVCSFVYPAGLISYISFY